MRGRARPAGREIPDLVTAPRKLAKPATGGVPVGTPFFIYGGTQYAEAVLNI